MLSCNEFIENDAVGKNVAQGICFGSAELLRRHVQDGAYQIPLLRELEPLYAKMKNRQRSVTIPMQHSLK